MNCQNPQESMDPCGTCPSCLDFQSTQPLDFIEIDGASHRGIDDIKSIIDTLAYSSSSRYKIILIDEVHMLTKEAFNALLKTLEEPPEHVKFIFATTESHKVPSTILSRTQRFDLARISSSLLISKLKKIAHTLSVEIEESVFDIVAERADGSLRDAESLFERVISGSFEKITLESVFELLGYFSTDLMEELDETFHSKNLKNVFLIADKLFTSGKDIKVFFDQYRQHLRHIVCAKLKLNSFISSYPLKEASIASYELHEATYLIETLTEQLKTSNFDKKIDTEALLLHLIQSKNRASLSDIVHKLEALSSNQDEELPSYVEPVLIKPTTQAQEEVKEKVCDKQEEPITETTAIQEDSLPLKGAQFYDTIMQFASVELEGSLKK
jgi:DNA polymerase-3 subunit gamma/tau